MTDENVPAAEPTSDLPEDEFEERVDMLMDKLPPKFPVPREFVESALRAVDSLQSVGSIGKSLERIAFSFERIAEGLEHYNKSNDAQIDFTHRSVS